MKNTIFDAWKTYPAVFLKQKKDDTLNIYKTITNQSFICGPDKTTIKKVTNSTIKTLVYMLGIGDDGKKTLKTSYISNIEKTTYNGFQLSFKYDTNTSNIVFLIQNKRKVEEIKFCSIQKIFDKLVKKNPTITIKVIEKLLIDGKMKFMFNVTEKDHGTKWIIKK